MMGNAVCSIGIGVVRAFDQEERHRAGLPAIEGYELQAHCTQARSTLA
ncbi:MAG: hypothetical protein ACQESG_04830 [Nanobdellota archaeon]